jgi:hypothetical protein
MKSILVFGQTLRYCTCDQTWVSTAYAPSSQIAEITKSVLLSLSLSLSHAIAPHVRCTGRVSVHVPHEVDVDPPRSRARRSEVTCDIAFDVHCNPPVDVRPRWNRDGQHHDEVHHQK